MTSEFWHFVPHSEFKILWLISYSIECFPAVSGNSVPDSLTPTVLLNALVMRRGEPAVYHHIEMPRPNYNRPANLDFRGMYNQRWAFRLWLKFIGNFISDHNEQIAIQSCTVAHDTNSIEWDMDSTLICTEIGILWSNWVHIMVVDALAPCVARTATAVVLTM